MLYQSRCGDRCEERKGFLQSLMAALGEDAKFFEDEVRQHRHEQGMRLGKRYRQNRLQNQFHTHDQCWYFYDEKSCQWLEEPCGEGSQYEVRRTKWRQKSFDKEEQQYFDRVHGRFYQYDPTGGQCLLQGRHFTR